MSDDEHGTSYRGTSQRGTENRSGPQTRCNEPMPYELDARIWWAFRCGMKEAENDAFNKMAGKFDRWSIEEVMDFVLAYNRGVALGCREALARYYEDLVLLVRGGVMSSANLADSVYDPEVYKGMEAFYTATPGSEAQSEALSNLSEYFLKEYPSLSGALRTLAVVSSALEVLYKWIQTDANAIAIITVAISSSMGQALGEEAETLLAAADSAGKLGMEAGRMVGSACTEVALLILGF